jgi:hypothetical protein
VKARAVIVCDRPSRQNHSTGRAGVFRSLWLAVFYRSWLIAAELVGHKLTSRFAFVPSKTSPASRALIRGFVQRRSALRASNASVNERASEQADRTEKEAQCKAAKGVIAHTGNNGSGNNRGQPRPHEIASHHAHPLANRISSRIGPATMQARRSRAIRRDGFMGDRIDADGRNVK